MSSPLHLTVSSEPELADLLSRHARLVLNFTAPWAAPARQMDAAFAALAAVAAPVDAHAASSAPVFVSVPADALPAVAADYRVASVPTFVFLHDGRDVARVHGADPPALASRVTWFTSAGAAELETAALVEVTKEEDVMLFMKGKPDAPSCGFSRQIVDLLRRAGVVFGHCDVTKDADVRDGLKKLHGWPTYPQVYARGRLVGGLDRVRELVETDQLVAELVRDEGDPLPGVAKNGLKSAESVEGNGEVDHVASPAVESVPAESAAENGSSSGGVTSPAGQEPGGDLTARLQALVKRSRVMLFMKGSPAAPQCGFSRRIVAMLQKQNVEFDTFDILQDSAVRQGLKDLYKWPTFPQLYSEGELIGGLDIIQGLVEDGGLKDELGI